MTGRLAFIPATSTFALVLLGLWTLPAASESGHPSKSETPTAILLEARNAAASIQDPNERSVSLDSIILAQIGTDPAAARDTLKVFSKLPKRLDYLTALAAAYAEAGNIAETERMYAEIVVEDQSSRPGKLAAANALGQLAIAYANKGNIEEASNTLTRLKERVHEETLPIVGIATGKLVEAHAKKGDFRGAVQTALSIIEQNPLPLTRIVRDRFRSGKVQEVQNVIAGLDERSQPYAQWGIVQAQVQQDRLIDAQLTASGMKPGHAKASALFELATYHLEHGPKPLTLVLLKEAEASAQTTANPLTRTETLRHIAAGTATAGDVAQAIAIAKSLEKDTQRIATIHDIVKAQAKRGDTAGAFNTAGLLKRVPQTDPKWVSHYNLAISDILVEMVKSGKGNEAKETVASFQDSDIARYWLYSGIAMAQADLGNIKEAKATLALTETEMQRSARRKELQQLTEKVRFGQYPADEARLEELWKVESEIQRALDAIAKALARKGDLSGAMTIADELNLPAHRLELMKELSAFHVQAGHKEQTLRWARTLVSPSERAYALLGIATALSREAEKRKAKPPLAEKLSNPAAH